MKTIKLATLSVIIIFAISCNQKPAEPIATLKKEEASPVKAAIDSAKILDLIKLATPPQESAAGGSTKEITKRTIKFYNDSNKDTTLVMLQINGTEISNKSVPNYGPDKPFETTENWKLYKVNGEMKAFKK